MMNKRFVLHIYLVYSLIWLNLLIDDRHFDLQNTNSYRKALVPIDSRCSISRCHSFWAEQLCHFDAKLCSAVRTSLLRSAVLLQWSFDESEGFRVFSVNFFGVVSLWILLSRIRKNLMLLLHFMCLLLMGTYNSSLSQEKELPRKILFAAQRRFTPNATWSRNLAVGSK